MKMLLRDARLILPPGEGIRRGWVLVEEGTLVEVGFTGVNKEPLLSTSDSVIECGGDFIAPGLIDIHCHGAVGRDAMEATAESFDQILKFHASRGTTTAVLTTVAASLAEMLAVLESAERYHGDPKGAMLAGIHLEGPYFSPRRRGAHREEMLRHPSREETEALLKHAGVIRRMTLAPELPGVAVLVREFLARGVVLSAGHSDATEEEALEAFGRGFTQVTHLHNAMSSLRKTAPMIRRGLAEAALESQGIACELIADGVHVDPGLLREAWRIKGWQRIILVSDATAGCGLGDGVRFGLGGLSCRVQGNAAWTDDAGGHCLAGSTSTLLEGVRVMVEKAGVPLGEALSMASLVPARSLGLGRTLGSLAPGKFADLIRFNEQWEIKGVWIRGNPIDDPPQPLP